MKEKRPRLIKFKPDGVMCNKCKYATCIDSRHMTYYCIPEDSSKSKIVRGEFSCGHGVTQ